MALINPNVLSIGVQRTSVGSNDFHRSYGLIYKKVPEVINSPTVDLGDMEPGGILTINFNGDWSNGPIIEYQYRYFRDGILIVGETANTYTYLESDEGVMLDPQVRARNSSGWSEWVSAGMVDVEFDPLAGITGLTRFETKFRDTLFNDSNNTAGDWDTVRRATDYYGVGQDFTSFIGAEQGILVPSGGPNDFPFIQFDGVDDRFENLPKMSSTSSVFLLCKTNSYAFSVILAYSILHQIGPAFGYYKNALTGGSVYFPSNPNWIVMEMHYNPGFDVIRIAGTSESMQADPPPGDDRPLSVASLFGYNNSSMIDVAGIWRTPSRCMTEPERVTLRNYIQTTYGAI